MANSILFVFEGEKTEKSITDSMKQFFVNENTIIQCAYCAEVYQLYEHILEDEDLDTFSLLKERGQNFQLLKDFKRDDFAEIYLFFDYDGQSTLADDAKIDKILKFFNEETTVGKLYISYPMVESLKHHSKTIDFKDLKVKAKENIKYKQIVNKEADSIFIQIKRYTKAIWLQLIELHLKKMNFIVEENYVFPSKIISQNSIFSKQMERFIRIDETVAVLNSFPIFLLDYYGIDFIADMLLNKIVE